MSGIENAWKLLSYGGPLIYPLLVLAVLAIILLLDKSYMYWRYSQPQAPLRRILSRDPILWRELEQYLAGANPEHHYVRFLRIVVRYRNRPLWWIESRAGDETLEIERELGRGMWVLETIVTAAPLLGLLGTIYGMMHAFRLFGAHGLVDPKGVTAGVATALIATAVGLSVAIVALFGYNYFSRRQANTIDTLERVGSRLLDHARMEQERAGE